jgi:hypothetical protein
MKGKAKYDSHSGWTVDGFSEMGNTGRDTAEIMNSV